MKTSFIVLLILGMVQGLWSQTSKKVLTQIITYKVNLRLDGDLAGESFSDPYFVYYQLSNEWFRNKLPPVGYQTFITSVHQAALRGKTSAYGPLFELNGYRPVFQKITPREVAAIGNDTIYKTMQRPYPPYDEYDTVIVNTFNPQDIVQIEFMEKWTFNPNTMRMKKRVIAFAPWRVRIHLGSGELIGVSPMYWVKCGK